MHLLAFRWLREPEIYQERLTRAILYITEGKTHALPSASLMPLIPSLHAVLRRYPTAKTIYQFLQLFYNTTAGKDLEKLEDLTDLVLRRIPYDLLFNHLAFTDSLARFERLRNVKGDLELAGPTFYHADNDLIHIAFLSFSGKAGEAEATAAAQIERRKE